MGVMSGSKSEEGEGDQEGSRVEQVKRSSLLPQVLTSLVVSLGTIMVGFTTGYSSPALSSMTDAFALDLHQRSWIGSLVTVTASWGALLGGPLMYILGRKPAIISTGPPLVAGYTMMAMAKDATTVMAGRAVTGFSLGLMSLVFPVYLAEVLHPKYRGVLSVFPAVLGNSGVLLSYTLGMVMDWSALAWTGAALPLPFVILTFVIPETPRYYITKGRRKAARKSLQWLRATDRVNQELDSMSASTQCATHANSWKPALIVLALMLFQQTSGINAVIFYSNQIFQESGSDMDLNIQSTILAAVNIASTLSATLLIDKLGRKPLLYLSGSGMVIGLVSLAVYFSCKTALSGYVPLVSLILYIVAFSLGFGPLPWLLMAELLPEKWRAGGAAVSTSFNWACSFLVTKTFETLSSRLGSGTTFWLYAASSLTATVFVAICLPETRGKSLQDIQEAFISSKTLQTQPTKSLPTTKP